jgi:ribosomal-protein-alanine N-acetyltransferase
MRKASAHDYFFHTIWIIIDKSENQLVGEIGFKGLPDTKGSVELAYSTFAAFQNSGYMTEAVEGVCQWCDSYAGIKVVSAETEVENEASQKVLANNGFELGLRRNGMLVWQRNLNSLNG